MPGRHTTRSRPATQPVVFDALPEVDQGVLRLLLHGRRLADIARVLRVPEVDLGVRALAGLDALARHVPLDAEGRRRAGGYLLGLQTADESECTYRWLCRDPLANEWTLTVAVALEAVAGSFPDLPELDLDVLRTPAERSWRAC